MADAALAELLDNISHMLPISGAGEGELGRLRDEVKLLRAFLRDMGNKPGKKKAYRKIERQIQEFALVARDAFSSYLNEAATPPAADAFSSYLNEAATPPACGRPSLTQVVRSFREKEVKPVLEKARIDFADKLLIRHGSDHSIPGKKHQINGSPAPAAFERPHQIKVINKALSLGEDERVGVEDEEATITGYLKLKTKKLDFISIVGTPGVGKTTLARRVYKSQLIKQEFPTRIWVNVSQDLNKKDVFIKILYKFTSKDMSTTSDQDLASAVHHFLEKRKFLLVLNDVWTPKDFNAIRHALPKCNTGSKVLVTSRSAKVGRHAMNSAEPHVMRLLREDECWELLQLQVFGGLNICPQQLIDIGQHIAGKCDGLPLTIIIVAGILAAQLSKVQSMSAVRTEWIEVYEYMRMYLPYETAVELGYSRLSDELKNLFLYLGVFPGDFEIPATTLTRLWIAEGFIQHQEGRSLEEVAEENLNNLIQRKLVIVDKVRSNGKAKSCHLHDTSRHFCIQKGSQANLFQEIQSVTSIQKNDRRLCIHSNLLEFFSSKPYIPSVRSFSSFCKTESLLLPEDTAKVPGVAFELLRVLDIKPIRFTRFPLELTRLFGLRYIVLSSDFKILPEFISKLRNIQTLIIHTSSRTLEIKANVWKMIHLRHLQTNASISLRNEPENHSDQELQTLTNLSPGNCTSSLFERASCLKKLGIRGILPILLEGKVGFRKFDHFVKLKELENLKLLNDVHINIPSESRLSCLPPTTNFPPNLRSLTLSATFLTWEHMSILGNLGNLEVLKLKDNAFVGKCWEVVAGGFCSLQVLQIGYTDLISWKTKSRHFPKLRSLALRNCEKLDTLPRGLKNIVSLQEIELLRPSKAATISARKIEEASQLMRGKHSKIKLSIYFAPDE